MRGKTFLQPDAGKCLHYYFYFIDEKLGLLYLRVPTWCPVWLLLFYGNGHGRLARKLRSTDIEFTLADNAFLHLSDLDRTQRLADGLLPKELHRRLNRRRLAPAPAIQFR